MHINETYDITIDGNVINTKTNRVLKSCISAGYQTLRLGVGKHYYIHHLVANAFLPSPTEENCVIDHIDRNKLHNHASNLRWVSRSVNATNRTIELKSRLNSKGEHHIKRVLGKRQINPTFVVMISMKTLRHYSSHSTLEEAIVERNSVLYRNAVFPKKE